MRDWNHDGNEDYWDDVFYFEQVEQDYHSLDEPDTFEKITGMFTFENVSITLLEAAIRLWSSKYKDIIYHNDKQPIEFAKNKFAQYVIKTYYRPKTIDIYPNKSLFYSSKKSLLGLWTNEDMPRVLSQTNDTSISERSYTGSIRKNQNRS